MNIIEVSRETGVECIFKEELTSSTMNSHLRQEGHENIEEIILLPKSALWNLTYYWLGDLRK